MATITQFKDFGSRDNTTAVSNRNSTSLVRCGACGHIYHRRPDGQGVVFCPSCGVAEAYSLITVLTALSYMDRLRAALVLADNEQVNPAYDYALAS